MGGFRLTVAALLCASGGMAGAGSAAAASDTGGGQPARAPSASLIGAWRMTRTLFELPGKKPHVGADDQGVLLIRGDRYAIIDADGEVADNGRFQPLSGTKIRLRSFEGHLDLDLADVTEHGAVLDGTLFPNSGGHAHVRFRLARPKSPPKLPVAATLPVAAQLGDVDAVAALLAAGAKVDVLDGGVSPLQAAAHSCHLGAVKRLLDAGASLELTSSDGKTALIVATESGDADVVRTLLARGAKVSVRRPSDQASPIVIAVADGSLDIVRALVDAGADLGDQDKYGRPLLVDAAAGTGTDNREVPELVAFLLDKKVDPNQRGPHGLTPLMHAALFGHERVMRLLLDHGADPKARDAGGRPISAYAAGRPALLKLLGVAPR